MSEFPQVSGKLIKNLESYLVGLDGVSLETLGVPEWPVSAGLEVGRYRTEDRTSLPGEKSEAGAGADEKSFLTATSI